MYPPSRICPICMEYLPHYCAAIVRVTTVRVSRKQGERYTKLVKVIEINDRMPPYESISRTWITNSKGGES